MNTRKFTSLVILMLSGQFLQLVEGQDTLPGDASDGTIATINDILVPTLTTGEFNTMLQDAFFDVILDVRSEANFTAGHVVGATSFEGLAEDSSLASSLLSGCTYCDIVIYGSSDEQSMNAMKNLQTAGFLGRLYSLETTTSSTRAELMVSTDPSVDPPCSTDSNESDLCYNKYLSYTSQLADGEGIPEGNQGDVGEVDLFNIPTLTAEELNGMIENGDFNVIIDTRSASDFTAGHLPGATLISGLDSGSSTNSLAGCEYCTIVVYGQSVESAADALLNLRELGFEGRLYNGQSTTEWTEAGFSLVGDTVSVDPPCSSDESVSNQCYNGVLAYSGGEGGTTTSPTGAPSTNPPENTSAANLFNLGATLTLFLPLFASLL